MSDEVIVFFNLIRFFIFWVIFIVKNVMGVKDVRRIVYICFMGWRGLYRVGVGGCIGSGGG